MLGYARRRDIGTILAGLVALGVAIAFGYFVIPISAGRLPSMSNIWLPAFLSIAISYIWCILMHWLSKSFNVQYLKSNIWLFVTLVLSSTIIIVACFHAGSETTFIRSYMLPIVGGVCVILFICWPCSSLLCNQLALNALQANKGTDRSKSLTEETHPHTWMAWATWVILFISLSPWMFLMLVVLEKFGVLPNWGIAVGAGRLAFDLYFTVLTTTAILMIGNAIIRYELFLGTDFPRDSLRRHWRRAVPIILIIVPSVTAFVFITRPESMLLLTLLSALVSVGYVLHYRITISEYDSRQNYMTLMRSLTSGARIYDMLIAGRDTVPNELYKALNVLCIALRVQALSLIPLGKMGRLIPWRLSYPDDPILLSEEALFKAECDIVARQNAPICELQVGERVCQAIPLWKNGVTDLIGVLLMLDNDRNAMLTEEELQLAQDSGIALIDMLASIRLAALLHDALHRQFHEEYLLSDHPRRILHDEIAAKVHAALLVTNDQKVQILLKSALDQVGGLIRDMRRVEAPEIQTLGVFDSLKACANSEFKGHFTSITWDITSEAEHYVKELPLTIAEMLYHAVREALRNAAKSARGDDNTRSLHMRVSSSLTDQLEITIADDGVGMQPSVTSQSLQKGLRIHNHNLMIFGGELRVDSAPSEGTRVILILPRSALDEFRQFIIRK